MGCIATHQSATTPNWRVRPMAWIAELHYAQARTDGQASPYLQRPPHDMEPSGYRAGVSLSFLLVRRPQNPMFRAMASTGILPASSDCLAYSMRRVRPYSRGAWG